MGVWPLQPKLTVHAARRIARKALASVAGATPETLFARRFLPGETQDVRLYLRGGNDAVMVRGGPGSIAVRVVDAGGWQDEGFDVAEQTTVLTGAGTDVDDLYSLPPEEPGFLEVKGIPPRDCGSTLLSVPDLSFGPDLGLLLGLSAGHTSLEQETALPIGSWLRGATGVQSLRAGCAAPAHSCGQQLFSDSRVRAHDRPRLLPP